VRKALLLWLIGSSALAQGFQTLDRIDGWLIERKLDAEQNPICRASIPGGGSWFASRVHLNSNDVLVIPNGSQAPDQQSVQSVQKALKRCRESLLYL